jgi:hypothetical protein
VGVDASGGIYAVNANNLEMNVFVATPSANGVSPSSGPAAGGTVVTVSGTGFTPGTTVTLDGTPVTTVAVSSPTSLSFTTPAHAAGTVGIVVATLGGTATIASAFTFTPAATPTYTGAGPTLATTGFNAGLLLIGGLLSAGIGGGLCAVNVSRRRRSVVR